MVPRVDILEFRTIALIEGFMIKMILIALSNILEIYTFIFH